jgi:hypothetical protein
LPLDPEAGLGRHLEVLPDGTIHGLTPAGADLIRICRLDRPNLTAFRRLILDALTFLQRKRDPDSADLRRRYLGYPANLADLAALKLRRGYASPQGIEQSAYARLARGELPEVY